MLIDCVIALFGIWFVFMSYMCISNLPIKSFTNQQVSLLTASYFFTAGGLFVLIYFLEMIEKCLR